MALSTDLDRVRLMIGDTDPDDPILNDDEVNEFIRQRSSDDVANLPAAAADCAAAIAAHYGRQFDFAEDGQSFSRAQRVAHYMQLEIELRKRQGGVSAPVRSAGVPIV